MCSPRTQARRFALLAIYQWQLGRYSISEITHHFYDDPLWMDALTRGLTDRTDDDPPPKNLRFDVQLFDTLLRGITENIEDVDSSLKPYLDRSLSSVDPVERAILRLAAFELLYSRELPSAVVIDEAIRLAKTFGAEQGHRYINGVLDKLAKNRPIIKP